MSGLELIPLIGSAIGGAASSAAAPMSLVAGTAAAGGAAGGGSLLGGLGTALSVGGTLLSGAAQMSAANQAAAQKEAQADTERAKAQRAAQVDQQKADLAMSRQQAVAAASGGGAGADAPSIVKIMTDTAGQGAYNAGMSIWNGEERARGLEASADADRATGTYSFLGSSLGAFGKAFNGWDKYR